MKKLFLATACAFFSLSHAAHAARFESVDEALIGWHYTYQASSQGHQVPVYFTLRKCDKPSVIAAQGFSPLQGCFATEDEARPQAQKWADTEELRYRDVQDPSPGAIKAIKQLWQKAWGE
jgi:hypothetical protein